MNTTTTKSIEAFTALVTLLALLFAQNLSAQIQSATSGDWHLGSTWVGGNVPSSSDEVAILAGHTVTMSAPVSIDMPGSLDVSGTLELTQAFGGSGTKNILSAGVLNMAGGSLAGGEWIIANGGTLNVNATAGIGSSVTLRNHGTFNWLNGYINEMGPYSCYYSTPPPSYLINETDGVWNISLATNSHLGATWITNHGVINKTTGYLVEFLAACAGSYLTNSATGSLNVTLGQMTFYAGTVTLNGAVDIDGTVLIYTGASIGGSIDLAGTLTLNGPTDLTTGGAISGSGMLNIGSTFNSPDPFTFTIPAINVTGNVTGTGIKTYASGVDVNLNGGSLTGSEHVLQSGSTLTINSGYFGSSTTIRNQGVIDWNSGLVNPMGLYSCYYSTPPPAIMLNESSGVLNLNQSEDSHLGATHVTNDGVISKSTSSLFTFHAGCAGSPVSNTANGEIKGIGMIQFDYGFTNSGTITPGLSPGELTLNYGSVANGTLDIQLYSASGPGTGHDRLNVNGNFTASGTLNVLLEGSYDPPIGTSFEIVSATGTIINEFTTVNYPVGMSDFYLTYNAQSIVLTRGTPPPPIAGEALDFDGINDYITIPGIPAMTNFTLEYWIHNKGTDGQYDRITSAAGGYQFETAEDNNVLHFHLGGIGWFSTGLVLPLGDWMHIAWVQDGNNLKLYSNGVLLNTYNYVFSLTAATWYLGRTDYESGNATMKLDELRIWNVARTESEIQTSMQCDMNDTQVGLVALYHFNQGIAEGNNAGETMLDDATANNFNGTLNNFSLSGSVSNWVAPGAALTGTCGCDDADMDTYTTCDGDCDDNNPSINPGATEVCNGMDDDCDGNIDEGCLVGHWKFNGNPSDETGLNPSSAYGDLQYIQGVDCVNPGAGEFDGFNDYIDIGNLNTLQNTKHLTVSAWIKPSSSGIYQAYVSAWNISSSDQNRFLLYNTDFTNGNINNGTFSVQFTDNSFVKVDGINQLPLNTWTMLTGVWNGATGELSLYKNGVLENQLMNQGVGKTLNYESTPSSAFPMLGRWDIQGSPQYYQGGMDHVRIYNDALDANEIQNLFASDECDIDGDGYTESEGDCNDSNDEIYPGATEICNNEDDDCDGLIDEGLADADNDGICDAIDICPSAYNPDQADTDNDGHGDACDNCPSTFNPGQEDNETDGIGDVCDPNDDNDPSNDANDCAPFNPLIYPGATEVCGDLVDNDCDGLVDEPLGIVVLDEEDILCNGQPTGLISVEGTCGLPPYTYSWNNGASTPTISNLSVGTYKVTISDAQGLTKQHTFYITQPTMLTVSTSRRNVSCNGSADGSATANPNGGVSPYTYIWSNGATTKTADNLVAGTYTVTVTDNNLCTKTATVTITQPTPVEITSIDVAPDPGNPGKFIITVYAQGGTPYNDGYRYRRCNPNGTGCAAWRVSNVFTNMPAGSHLMKVKDKIGCTDQQLVTIENPPALQIVPDAIMVDEANDHPIGQMEVESTYVYKPLEVIGMTLLPNPGREFVVVRWNAPEIGYVQITMHDLSGKLMHQEKVEQLSGMNEYKHSTSEFKPGMYIVTLKTPQTTLSNFWIKAN